MEALGKIGQHSCSDDGEPDQKCNEIVSQHALDHGVSYGSIAAFVTYISPDDVAWFSREQVDGYGISRYPGEKESGFEKSEPFVIRHIVGSMPPAQAAWRLDFMNDGYRAFARTISDADREMQMNLFCYEPIRGSLFLSLELHGAADEIRKAISQARISLDDYDWIVREPMVVQMDPVVSSVVVPIPEDKIIPFLTRADLLTFRLDLLPPYKPMQAATRLARSRSNLIFAANHCPRGGYDLSGRPG